jgi:hydroxypyruvate reductase
VAAADAGRLLTRALTSSDLASMLDRAGSVHVVAAGKAAAPMMSALAAGAMNVGTALGIGPAGGEKSLRAAAAATTPFAQHTLWYAASHPLPDERSVRGAQAALDLAASLDPDDALVLLLSGGASAMMALPADGISLDDKRRTIQVLLAAGADIRALNAVRKHMSAIKGGQLAAACAAPVVTLAMSDVVGDDLSVIGSGPTVADASTFEDALAVLDRRGGRASYPGAVVYRLERGCAQYIAETPKPGDPRLAGSVARVIGGRFDAMEGAAAMAASLGYAVDVIHDATVGEARFVGQALVERAAAEHGRRCVIASGETTVHVTGGGKGGRNQECALGMLVALDRLGERVAAASIGTDGIDGPTDAAGAVVDSTTLARAEADDVGPVDRYLNDNNTYEFFNKLGDLIRLPPTGTNVGDLQAILID